LPHNIIKKHESESDSPLILKCAARAILLWQHKVFFNKQNKKHLLKTEGNDEN